MVVLPSTSLVTVLEISLADGPNVKQKVSQAVLRKTAVIRNAKDMKDYLEENFTTPAASTFESRIRAVGLAHRVFFYIPTEGDEAVVRCRPRRTFWELKSNRKIHYVHTTSEQGMIVVRHHSCYCLDCIYGEEEHCTNKESIDD